jgi:hypothetical protein
MFGKPAAASPDLALHVRSGIATGAGVRTCTTAMRPSSSALSGAANSTPMRSSLLQRHVPLTVWPSANWMRNTVPGGTFHSPSISAPVSEMLRIMPL